VTRVRLSRIFWIGAAAILIAAALLSLVAVLRGDFSDTDGRILGTLGAVLLAGSTAIAGLAVADRGGRAIGWGAIAVAAPGFAAMVFGIWELSFDGDENAWQWGWSGALAVFAALIAATAQLLARSPLLARLAWVAGGLAIAASSAAIAAIWHEDPGDTAGKAIGALWILTALAYFLVPVLQRFTSAGVTPADVRVLAELDGVELVASRGHIEGVRANAPETGEQLVLRRRTP
jgi:hypothetical protein